MVWMVLPTIKWGIDKRSNWWSREYFIYLFHVIDVVYSWLRGIQGKEDIVVEFAEYDTPEKLKSLSDRLRNEIAEFLKNKLDELKEIVVCVPGD